MNESNLSKAWPRAILFDLDGTLIDSAPDLHAAVNILIARRGLGPLSLDQVKSMIGNGVKKLVERAFAACGVSLSGEALEAEHLAMIDVYGDHLTVLTTLMPGVPDVIEAVREDGVQVAVVTNKPQRAAEAILDDLGLSPYLDAVIGGDAGVEKKPAPDMLLAALDVLGVAPEDALAVGDSPVDVAAARAAGVLIAAVRGGYTTVAVEELGADAVIDGLDLLSGAIALTLFWPVQEC